MREILANPAHLKLLLEMLKTDALLLSNIEVFKYEAMVFTEAAPNTPTRMVGVIALNKDSPLSLEWQAEYFLMAHRGVFSFKGEERITLKKLQNDKGKGTS